MWSHILYLSDKLFKAETRDFLVHIYRPFLKAPPWHCLVTKERHHRRETCLSSVPTKINVLYNRSRGYARVTITGKYPIILVEGCYKSWQNTMQLSTCKWLREKKKRKFWWCSLVYLFIQLNSHISLSISPEEISAFPWRLQRIREVIAVRNSTRQILTSATCSYEENPSKKKVVTASILCSYVINYLLRNTLL